MTNQKNTSSDDKAIQAIEQAWQKFQKEMDELKSKQLAIIKKYKEKIKQEELEKAKKELD